MTRLRTYLSRWQLALQRCRGRRVLHLGCIGITDGTVAEKVHAMVTGQVLHAQLRPFCADLVGVDCDQETVRALAQAGFAEICYGDVEQLEALNLSTPFDIILCGDLIEHLGAPGRMLEGTKRFMTKHSELLITTPNAFGLLPFMRYATGRFREGNGHLLSFSLFTLENLLRKHHLGIEEAYTCYDRPPSTWTDRWCYALGVPFFKAFPRLGGTLLVVAKRT